MSDSSIRSRKDDHIRINLEENVESGIQTGLSQYHFIHNALPELDLQAIDISQTFFGKKINTPILISSMTGGTNQAKLINERLAKTAQQFGLMMGVGSQRAAIENEELSNSFAIRQYAPDILLLANLGAVQLNYGYGIDQVRKAVDMINADALILHLNPLQEAIQPNGDTNFSGLLNKIEKICNLLEIPVIVKEVGWGISVETARSLIDVGVQAIDIAGAGGTSWSQVERFRLDNPLDILVAESFKNWGIPTVDSLLSIRSAFPDFPIIASGGLKTGMDLAKTLALGANAAGLAGVFLKAAIDSEQTIQDLVTAYLRILKISMFVTGSKNLETFRKEKIQLFRG
ncbi:MAG: type 2 isopentenyl-diphosphate Delta-isomerase [Anaerolineaceae bacterium]|nr:type 2 isopentenyl-diphosphate Delta-isomerase [Anaerolineaceae bacterium]